MSLPLKRVDLRMGPNDTPGTPFVYPHNLEACVLKVLRGGEYDHPNLPDYPKVRRVLDIGANVGAFAVWASRRWPGCWIDCYEPNPQAAELCRMNAPPGTKVHELAVIDTASPECTRVPLHLGTDWGYSSTYRDLNPSSGEVVEVDTLHPALLPSCDVLKVDAEGVEVEIFGDYTHWDDVKIAMFEWHREDDRRLLEDACDSAGLRCFRLTYDRPNMGQQVWLRSNVVFDHAMNAYVARRYAL